MTMTAPMQEDIGEVLLTEGPIQQSARPPAAPPPARQAAPPARRDPRRLHGLHDPRPVRRRLRPRLRRALSQPALRRRPQARGLRGPGMTMHRRPVGRARLLAALAAVVVVG